MQALVSTKKDVYQELGQAELEERMARIQQAHAELDAKEREVAQARAKLDTCSAEALQALQPWQSLRDDLKPYCTYHDSPTNVMEAMINFLSVLLQEGYQSNLPLENIFYKITAVHIRQLAELLQLDQDMINEGLVRFTPPIHLLERKKQLQQVLSVYRNETLKG